MGCVGSKSDDSPAVDLCMQRCRFLDEAIHQRYALAQSHLAYFHSLKSVGDSLHRFFDLHLADAGDAPPLPVLNLPPHRKADSVSAAPAVAHRRSHSNSGESHLHFHSDSDGDSGDGYDSGESTHLHSDDGGGGVSPPRHPPYGDLSYPYLPAGYPPAGFPVAGYHSGEYTMNYMRNQTMPSVLYQQKPTSTEIVHYGEASTYYSNNHNNNQIQNPNFSNFGEFFGSSSSSSQQQQQPPFGVLSSFSNSKRNYSEFFGSSSQQQAQYDSVSSSNSKPPPPPPPSSSAWDFLNPFETFEGYYPPYTPSRDSREFRDEEGIPDLEDEDFYQKEVDAVAGSGTGGDDGDSHRKPEAVKETVVEEETEEKAPAKEDVHYRSLPVAKEDDPVEYEVHVVDKEVVDNNGNRPVSFENDSEVVKAIQTQFDRASECGNELAKILEVGKVPHNRKHAAYQVPSKMLNVFTPSLSLAPADPDNFDMDVDLMTKSKNLSSTLHKLYLWEKKLFDEVKIEEKMRLLHEEKSRRLRRLDEKGAEPHKVDATRTLVRSLSTKIRIAIQVVDKISEKVNDLRDEELWPQLNDFIQGLTTMWKSMLECHRYQHQAIIAAKRLDAVASHKHFTDATLEATLQLEHELLNWAIRFSCWFTAQKGFIRALNNWLLKCLLYVPEETPDGPVPFSPSRIGAPPVFIICNHWAQAMDRVSDKEVVDSMRDFATTVLRLWEQDKVEMRERMVVNKNMEKTVKNLDREDQKIHKELQALDKMIVVASGDDNGLSLGSLGHAVYQSETSKKGSLQTSMQRVFESMERFTATSLKAYEELLQRVEEDKPENVS